MSTVEDRKNDRTAKLIWTELSCINGEAVAATAVNFASLGSNPAPELDMRALLEAAKYLRYVYALYVAQGVEPLAKIVAYINIVVYEKAGARLAETHAQIKAGLDDTKQDYA